MLEHMSEHAALRLRLSAPADLVEAVPYLLGYHPSDSLVALALRGERRKVGFTMRLDLPQADDGDIAAPLARSVAAYLVHAGADQAVLVVYGDVGDVLDGLPQPRLIGETTTALQRRGVEVVEALYVGAGRWWSYLCNRPTCCPSEGTPIPVGGCSTVVATATYAGLVALPNRAAVERSLDPVGVPAANGMTQALAEAEQGLAARITDEASLEVVRAESRAMLTAAVNTGPVLSDDVAARLIVGLEDIAVRDECCEWTETERGMPAQQLWVQLARRAVPEHAVVPLVMVAWFAWRAGDATLARVAVERCLLNDPAYSLAILLRDALDSAVDPATLVAPVPTERERAARRRR